MMAHECTYCRVGQELKLQRPTSYDHSHSLYHPFMVGWQFCLLRLALSKPLVTNLDEALPAVLQPNYKLFDWLIRYHRQGFEGDIHE